MAKPGKTPKTNAMRALDTLRIAYEAACYESPGFMDGVSVARAIGKPLEECFKTLVTRGASRANYVFVIPVAAELDLKKAAASVGEKSVAMLPSRDITSVTGYVKGGCSPIGMKKLFPTVIDASAQRLAAMTVSAGRLGMQLTLNPQALARVCRADFAAVTV